jgi:D-methionine transport system permease protein
MSLDIMRTLVNDALWQTLYMVLVALVCSSLLGIPLGMLLFSTRKNGIVAKPWLNSILGGITNAVRSIPFIILLVAIVPFTRLVVGTSIGTNAAIVPLVIGAIPFIGRIVENALEEVPAGLSEAAQSMGATPLQIMWHFLLPEALPGIINGLTVTVVALVSYSAMAGAVGGGGLGDLGIRYGYQRFDVAMMITTVIVLIVLVQILQWLGGLAAKHFNKR